MESSIIEKLEGLVLLQKIDSNLDDIKKRRGELPQEARDLEDEIAGLETRVNNQNQQITDSESDIEQHRQQIKVARDKIEKYEKQQEEVRNNREYDAISKETEYQELEILSLEKKNKTLAGEIDLCKVELEKTTEKLNDLQKILQEKQEELEALIKESEAEEQKFTEERTEAVTQIDDRLYRSYNKIRQGARNGLAVVFIQRGACGGCFNLVPPQHQAEVKERKKILICEHCGRILAGVEQAPPTEKSSKRKRATTKKKPAAKKTATTKTEKA